MNPARRVQEMATMAATRTRRASSRRRPAVRRVKSAAHKLQAVPRPRPAVQPPAVTLFRVCKPGWAVIVEKTPAGVGTRFVCPFCPQSHRVPGPVRGFQKVRRGKWVNLRRVAE
jgi:hypothetical protein